MSKRFGRKQKREMREEIDLLTFCNKIALKVNDEKNAIIIAQDRTIKELLQDIEDMKP